MGRSSVLKEPTADAFDFRFLLSKAFIAFQEADSRRSWDTTCGQDWGLALLILGRTLSFQEDNMWLWTRVPTSRCFYFFFCVHPGTGVLTHSHAIIAETFFFQKARRCCCDGRDREKCRHMS